MWMFFAPLDLKVWQVSIFQMCVLVKFQKSPGKIRCPNKFGATCFKTLAGHFEKTYIVLNSGLYEVLRISSASNYLATVVGP